MTRSNTGIILTILLGCIFFGCNPPYKHHDRDRLVQTGTLLYLVQRSHNNPPLDPSECTTWSNTNREFNNRYRNLIADSRDYKNLIIGDSTMDISGRWPGFLNPAITQNLAVGGNNLCDMNRQMFVINSTNPENVLISTPGGNDILQGVSRENRSRSMELLIERIQSRFPSVKISIIAVHPTQIDFANQERQTHNQAMRDVVLANWDNSRICWIDPLPLFGDGSLGDTDSAPDSNMIRFPSGGIDPVHYNQEMSFALKGKLEEECNLFL